MRRPSKKKVDKTDMTAEDGDEVAVDTGITGEQQPALNESTEATAKVDAAAGPGGRKWKVAFDAFENASMAAIRLRCIENEQGKQEKLAERLHDAKMRQLVTGPPWPDPRRLIPSATGFHPCSSSVCYGMKPVTDPIAYHPRYPRSGTTPPFGDLRPYLPNKFPY
jgi:hypothetical protein